MIWWKLMFMRLRAALGIVQQAINGAFQVNGVDIPPAIPLTFAAMQALDHTQYGTLFYLCTDLHSVGTTGGSLWQNDAVGDRVVLRSAPPRVADLSTVITTYAAASYTGVRFHLIDWDFPVESNGTRWKPVGGRATIFHKQFGTLTTPTLSISSGTSYDFLTGLGTPTFPANMFAVTDNLLVQTMVRRRGANATIPHKITLGTAGTNSDASVWAGTLAAADVLCVNTRSNVYFGSTTAFITNGSSNMSGTGGTGQILEGTTNVNTASAMKLSCNGATKNASDTVDLLMFQAVWETV